MARDVPKDLFSDLADFEAEFFINLVRSYALLDLGMRGFFFNRVKQVIKETIDLVRAEAERAASPRGVH